MTGDGGMDDLLKICEDNLDEHEIFHVRTFLKGRLKKAPYSLRTLCNRNPELMASTISCIALLERIEESRKVVRDVHKEYDPIKEKYMNKYIDATNIVLEMNPDKHKLIKNEFLKFIGTIHQYIITPPKFDITYNEVLKDLVEELQKDTGHTGNAVFNYLSDLLNELGCTSPQGARFTRQLIRSRITS
jgi:hypothetical protein